MPKRLNKIISILISILLLLEQSAFAADGVIDLSSSFAKIGSGFVKPEVFRPIHLRYLQYFPQDNNFKLLLDKGSQPNNSVALSPDSNLTSITQDLMKYFYIGLTLPNDTFWVNLRPDSPDNIIDQDLAKTELGKILLEADLQLKKDTAQFTSPQSIEGKEYWSKLYKKAEELFGTDTITIPTLTRPWIVPGEIIVRETTDSAYIYKATLKVMLEEDYLKAQDSSTDPSLRGDTQSRLAKPAALPSASPRGEPLGRQSRNQIASSLPLASLGVAPRNDASSVYSFTDPRLKELNSYSTKLIKELIIPKLTKEVNSSKRYASLRQVYYSLIMAQWFKARYHSQRTEHREHSTASSLRAPQGRSNLDSNVANLIDSKNLSSLTSKTPWNKQDYFNQYQQSFTKGEYNTKETVYTPSGQVVRSYMSGGMMLKVNFSKLGDALAVNSAGSPIVVVAIPSRNIEPQTIAESINAVVITARIPSESGLSKLEIAVGNEFPEKVNNTKLGLEKLPIAFDARVAAPSLNEFLRREKKSGGGNVSSASSAVENKTEPSPLFTVTNDETRDEIAMFSDLNTLNFNKPVSFKIKAGSDIRVGHFERKFTYLLEKKLLSLGAKEVEEGTSFVREVPAEGDTLEVTLETKRSKLKDRFIINYTIKAVEGSKIQYSYSGSYSITTANGSDGLDYINTIGVKNKIYRLLYVAAGDDLATIVEYLDNFPAINEVWMEDLHFDVNSLASELEIRLKLALNSDQLSKLKDTGKLDIGIFYNGRMIILHFREQDALLKASEGNNSDLIIVKLPGSRGTTSEHKDFWPRVLSRAHVGSLICVRLATPPKGLVDYSFWERLGQALRIGSVKKYFKTLIGRKNHGLGDFVLEELRWVQPSYFREITGKNNKVLLLYPKKNNDLLFSILNGLVKDWVVIRVEPESIVNGWSRVSGVGSSALENKIEPSPLVRVNMGMVPFDDGNIGVIGQNFADRAYGGYLDSDTVIAEIREIAARDGLDALRSGTIQKTNKRLYGRGLSQSGGWGDAVIMAGFEYIDGRPGVSISKDEVLDRIRKIASEKGVEELKPEYVQETDEGFKLYSAAMLYFGTWGKAVAAVFDYDQIKKRIEKDVQDASEETGSSSRRVKVDLFSKYPLLSSYQPQDLKSTLQWLNLHREELGGCSFKQLIRVFIEKGRLPEGENAQTWERGASAFVFYLNNRLLQTYQPKDLRTTLYWLEQHRFDLGGNSLNYLVDALSIAGKLPKDVSEETWKFAAGAYDFYLKSNLLKEYQPKEIRRTLNWLYEHRDELGNNSLSYLVFCFSVAGKIPEENERRWGTEAGSFARAIQEKKVILREIKRIWQSGEGWVGFINDISRLRALFNPKLLLNLRTGKPVSYGYRIRILSYAYDLYGKEYIRKIKNKGDGFKFSGSSPVDDSVNSASSGVEKKGGIDFRALPIVTQAVSSLGLNTMSYDLRAKLSQLDVNAELAAINKLLNAGITPSTDRLKACAQAAYLFSQSPEENAKILSCIAQLLRKEESECCDTESVLKDILIVLEAG